VTEALGDLSKLDKLGKLGDLSDLGKLGDPLGPTRPAGPPGRRIEVDPDNVERGLVQLVLTVVELLRQLMERQALRRVEAGNLSDEQVERLGTALMLLEERMEELKKTFEFEDDDLNLDLGPLGRLL
jgi:Gas vesicle protein K